MERAWTDVASSSDKIVFTDLKKKRSASSISKETKKLARVFYKKTFWNFSKLIKVNCSSIHRSLSMVNGNRIPSGLAGRLHFHFVDGQVVHFGARHADLLQKSATCTRPSTTPNLRSILLILLLYSIYFPSWLCISDWLTQSLCALIFLPANIIYYFLINNSSTLNY